MNPIQVKEKDWNKQDISIRICELPLSVFDIEKLFGFEFFEFTEPGLGCCFAIVIRCHGQLFWLQGYIAKDTKEIGVVASVPGNTMDTEKCLVTLCECLCVKRSDLIWSFDMNES